MAQSHARPYVVRLDHDVLDFASTFWDDLSFLREHDVAPILIAPDRPSARAIVQRINRATNSAVGLSGSDAAMLPTRGETLGTIQTGLLETLLAGGFIPVIEPTGFVPFGGEVDIDADAVAGKVAAAVAAIRALFFSSAGPIVDPATAATLADLTPAEALALADDGRIHVQARSAMRAAALGVRAGVSAAQIFDGRTSHALITELLTKRHLGTEVRGSLFLGDYAD